MEEGLRKSAKSQIVFEITTIQFHIPVCFNGFYFLVHGFHCWTLIFNSTYSPPCHFYPLAILINFSFMNKKLSQS